MNTTIPAVSTGKRNPEAKNAIRDAENPNAMRRNRIRNAARITMNTAFCRSWFRNRCMVGDLLYRADRAEIPAEKSPGHQGQHKNDGKSDRPDNERCAQSLHIPEHKLLELQGQPVKK